MRRAWRAVAVGLAVAALAVPAAAQAAAPMRPGGDLAIKVLSNRADLVSGGDALVQVVLPPATDPKSVTVDVDGRPATNEFAVRRDGTFQGLVTGLKVGDNVVTARLSDGYGARLVIRNHPQGGPVFAGPQPKPWICTTEANGLGPPRDAQCNAPTRITYSYKSAVTSTFLAYDPEAPPPAAAIATARTDQGVTLPYIVRQERGVIDRGVYDITVLTDLSKPWTPWSEQPAWNHKLLYVFGGGCQPGHTQAMASNTLIDRFLKTGHMVAGSSLNIHLTSCNGVVDAESVMMVKERIKERYGPIRFTIGDGCSGGAQAQHMIAAAYPGLLDGLRPECDFPDLWTPVTTEHYDCALLDRYFLQTSPQLWLNPLQRAAVLGGPLIPVACTYLAAFDATDQSGANIDWKPDGSGCQVDGPWKYDPETNRKGTRCTLQDYNVNIVGRRSDGFANRPIDRVGVQYGLAALFRGDISPAQFADLNAKVGGHDIDFNWTPQRSHADTAALANLYRTGQLASGHNWELVPEISVRADDTYDEHGNVFRDIARARIDRATGGHASQVFWTELAFPGAEGVQPTRDLSFAVIDEWLTNIERDQTALPLAAKVAKHKPARALDGACFAAGTMIDTALCDAVRTPQVLPTQVAGAPATADILKCQLKPLRMVDYSSRGVTFTAAQWAALQRTFPDGVCDWSKPGVGQQASIGAWLTYDGVVGGRPMGPAPASVPFAPRVAGAVIPVTGGLPWAPFGGLLLAGALAVRVGRRLRRA